MYGSSHTKKGTTAFKKIRGIRSQITSRIFKPTGVAAALLAAVLSSGFHSLDVFADEFTAANITEVQLQDLLEKVELVNLNGPFEFSYVSGAPKRVGFLYTGSENSFSKNHSIVIKDSISKDLFGPLMNGTQPIKDRYHYLCLIGAYASDDVAKWKFENVLNAFDGNTFDIEIKDGVTFWANDIYAANQDTVNTPFNETLKKEVLYTIPLTDNVIRSSADGLIDKLSAVQNSELKINLAADATLNFQRIVSGKTITWREISGGNNEKPWTYAYNNTTAIIGAINPGSPGAKARLVGKSTYDIDNGTNNTSIKDEDYKFYFRSAIIGGSAFIANNNTVSVSNVVIDNISKKYGIVGGRAYDGTRLAKNTLYGCSADGNGIYISNSEIGMDQSLSGTGINIYGALSYGTATNNFAILENSTFNGNVYGAAAALGSILDNHEYGTDNKGGGRNEAVFGYHFYTYNGAVASLSSNSLNNDQILYLFNKAENQYNVVDNEAVNKNNQTSNDAFNNKWVGLSDTNTISLHNVTLTKGSSVYASAGIFVPIKSSIASFENAQVVNLRRGTAYIGGRNTASSIYAKNLVFGRYYTQNESGEKTFRDDKAVRLGENISASFVENLSGFHSSLSKRTDAQSDITNGKHNFWSNVTAVLGDTMNGNGQDLAVNNNVFDASGNIINRNFSLLALDNNDSLGDHYFANSAKLYFAVSKGDSEGSAPIAINWTKIAEYRLSFASGGQYSPDGKLNIPTDGTLPTFQQSYSPFPIVSVEVGDQTFGPKAEDRLLISSSELSADYIQKLKNSSFTTEITVNQSDSAAPEGQRKAATAIFDIGQYMDFGTISVAGEEIKLKVNGKDEVFANKGDYISYVSPTENSSWEGGIGLRYKLRELRLSGPLQLILYGQNVDSIEADTPEDGYTLDAKLSQDEGVNGGIIVYQGQKAVIRTEYSDELTQHYSDKFNKVINHVNEFSGPTTVQVGSVLELEGNNALGTENVHTNSLFLHDGSKFNLRGYKQVIGSLNENNAALKLNGTTGSGTLNILQTPDRGSFIRGTLSGTSDSVISVANGTTSITTPEGTGYTGIFNVLSGSTTENAQPTSGGSPVLFTTVYLASAKALEKATIHAQDGTSLVFDNGGTDSNYVTVKPDENGIRHYYAGGLTAGSGYVFISNPNLQVQNIGIVPHHLHVDSMNLNGTNLVFSTLFEKDENGFVDNSRTDRIYVENEASGSGNVLINALPGSDMGYTTADGGILLVAAPNADANFKLSKGQVYIVQENRLSRAGDNSSSIKYELKSKNEEDGKFEDGANKYWYLVSSVDGSSPDDTDHPTPSNPNDPVIEPTQPGDTTPSKNPDGSFTPGGTRPGHGGTHVRPQVAAFAANALAWDKLSMRLHDRIGESYFLDPETQEIKKTAGWVRFQGTHGHVRVDRSARTNGNYMTTQIGTDLFRADLREDWRLIGGLFFGNLYAKTHTSSLLKARSKVNGFGGGAYLTLFSGNSPDDGFYTDLWVSYNRFKNEVSGDEPSVKYHAKGMTYSGEVGYTIHAATTGSTPNDKVDWYVQPQFQATLQGVKADNFTDWTGNRVKQDGKNNVQLRTGVRIYGRQSAKGNVFVEANWIHNTKKQGVISGAESYYADGTRNSGEGRIGWEGNLTKNLLGSVTGSVRAGNRGYNEVSGNISVKYLF